MLNVFIRSSVGFSARMVWAKGEDDGFGRKHGWFLGKCWNEFGEPFVVERMWV